VGDLLYQGSCGGVFYAFARQTGEVRWAYDTAVDGEPVSFHGDPLVGDGLIVTGADAPNLAHLYAFDLRTGAVRWKRPFGAGVPSDVLGHGSDLLAVTASGETICLAAADGATRWSVPARAPGGRDTFLKSSLLLRGDRLFVALGDGTVRAHDATSGATTWEIAIGSPANTSLAGIGGSLYLGTENVLLRIDGEGGRILATRGLGGRPYGTPIAAGDGLLVLVEPGRLVRLDPALEAVAWEVQAEEWSSFRPLLRDDLALVGSAGGEVRAVRLRDGAVAWTATVAGALRGLGFAGGIYYFGTLGGMLYAYER
jgi:outer membrane protein assembly factor BamB